MKLKNDSMIVFAGDSTTDADKLTTTDRLGNGYVRLVHNALAAFCPQNRYKVVNAGVGGDRSCDLLARWEKDVASVKPDIVFCMIGINDIWRQFDSYDHPEMFISPQGYEKNLSAICEKAKDVSELVFMLPYYMEANRTDAMRAMVDEYAAIMRKVAAKYSRPVLDTQQVFDEYMRSRSGQSINWDRVHPNQIGSMLLARLILQSIEVW